MPPAPPVRSPSGPLRVALTTGAYNHIADGVALTLNRVVGSFAEAGIEGRVYAPTTARPALAHAGTLVPVPSVTAPGRPDYRVAVGLTPGAKRDLAAFAPDVVSVSTPDLLGLGGRRWALRHGTPLVGIYHTHFASYLDAYGLGRLEPALWRYLRWFYRPFRHVYVPSPSMEAVLQAHGFGANLRPWPRGVETDRFAPEKRDLEWRRSLGFADADVVVAWVGRLVVEKGLGVFAEMAEAMRARGLAFKVLAVGDGPARADFEGRLAAALGPGGAVFTGTLRGSALARAYASADLFVFPSETESFGNVTLEAMASGLPAVCADAPGSASLVVRGETGFLCPPRDAAAFATAAGRLVADAGLRHAMGAAARERALTYRWDAVLARLHAYLREAAA